MRKFILPCLLLAACAGTPLPSPPATPDAVIAAERAFAGRGAEVGWVQAFRDYAAPDGEISRDVIVNAQEALAGAPDAGRLLFWWPAYAGIARSGDLGFTTGPYSIDEARVPRGQYFTVWRRQTDGSWRWIWDGGPGPGVDPLNHGVDAPSIPTLPVAAAGVGSAALAVAQVEALERAAPSAGALAGRLAAGAEVYRPRRARAAGPPGESFVFPNADIAYSLTRTEGSAAGDMVFTLGNARWSHDGTARQGFFARIWQYQDGGWRIVYDQLTPAGPPPPPAN